MRGGEVSDLVGSQRGHVDRVEGGEVESGEKSIDGEMVMVVYKKKNEPKPTGFTDLFPKRVTIPKNWLGLRAMQ